LSKIDTAGLGSTTALNSKISILQGGMPPENNFTSRMSKAVNNNQLVSDSEKPSDNYTENGMTT
jgi:hypothetical protein